MDGRIALFGNRVTSLQGPFWANQLATIRATPARADKRPMTVAELRTFWAIAKASEGTTGALMRLHLLTGGQLNVRLDDGQIDSQRAAHAQDRSRGGAGAVRLHGRVVIACSGMALRSSTASS